MIIDVEIVGIYGYKASEVMNKLSEKVLNEIERITALNVKKLNIIMKSIYMEKELEKADK